MTRGVSSIFTIERDGSSHPTPSSRDRATGSRRAPQARKILAQRFSAGYVTLRESECRRHDRVLRSNSLYAVPTGLSSQNAHPALPRWAKIFRPASGTRALTTRTFAAAHRSKKPLAANRLRLKENPKVRNRVRVKVAAHSVADHLPQLIHRISLSEDCMA